MRSQKLRPLILALSNGLKLRGKLIILLLFLLPYSPILAAPKVDIETPEIKEAPDDDRPELTTEPQAQPNPFINPELEDLVEKQISDDVWTGLQGELPCAIASTDCISQLQNQAVQSSKLLR